MIPYIDHRLHKEQRAADVLKEQLRAIADGDEDFLRDTIEGQTNLRELIAAVCEEIQTDGALVAAIAAVIEKLRARSERISNRIAMRRTACLAAMQTCELKTIETPAGTVTVKTTPQTAVILEEALVPSKFWKPQDPKLDKKAVLDALKAREIVPGAQLSNGGITLQLRM